MKFKPGLRPRTIERLWKSRDDETRRIQKRYEEGTMRRFLCVACARARADAVPVRLCRVDYMRSAKSSRSCP